MNALPTRSWLWPSEVAEIFHVSKQTIYNWIECGKLQTILSEPPYKVPRQEVERLLNPHLQSK